MKSLKSHESSKKTSIIGDSQLLRAYLGATGRTAYCGLSNRRRAHHGDPRDPRVYEILQRMAARYNI